MSRNFVCIHPEDMGTYTGKTPGQAAHKAFSKVRVKHNLKVGQSVDIVLRETNTQKELAYEGTVKKLNPPKKVNRNGEVIVYKFQSKVRRLRERPARRRSFPNTRKKAGGKMTASRKRRIARKTQRAGRRASKAWWN